MKLIWRVLAAITLLGIGSQSMAAEPNYEKIALKLRSLILPPSADWTVEEGRVRFSKRDAVATRSFRHGLDLGISVTLVYRKHVPKDDPRLLIKRDPFFRKSGAFVWTIDGQSVFLMPFCEPRSTLCRRNWMVNASIEPHHVLIIHAFDNRPFFDLEFFLVAYLMRLDWAEIRAVK